MDPRLVNPYPGVEGYPDTELMQLYKTGRNPIQETRFQQLLTEAGIPFTVSNGTAIPTTTGGGTTGVGAAGQPLNAPDMAKLRDQVYNTLKPYYTQLAKEAQGDFDRAAKILEEDYVKGTRDARVNFAFTQKQQVDDLKNTLDILGITNAKDQESLIDDLNKRGMAVYQNNADGTPNVLKTSPITANTNMNTNAGDAFDNTSKVISPTDANMGRGGYELARLQQDQRLRQEAQQRAATRPIEEAGIKLKQYTNLPAGINPNQSTSALAKALSAPGVDRSQLGESEQNLVRGTEQRTRELQKTQEDLANQRSNDISSIAIPLGQTGVSALGSQMENQILKEKQNSFVSTGA